MSRRHAAEPPTAAPQHVRLVDRVDALSGPLWLLPVLPGCSLADSERRVQHREACNEAAQHYAEDEPMYIRLPFPEDLQDEPMDVRMRMHPMYARMSPSRSAAEEDPEPVRQRPPQRRRRRRCAAKKEPEPVQEQANEVCDEEEWARRLAHREEAVAAVKRSQDYRLVRGARVLRPKTPDPTDRAVSKRTWERGNQEWRKVLNHLVEFHRLRRLLRLNLTTPNKLVQMTDDVGCHWRPPLAMRSWRAA